MSRSSKVRLFLIAVATGAAVLGTLPANAGVNDRVAIAGTGGISPGLTTGIGSGSTQTFTFDGTGAGAVSGQIGTYRCSVTGNDTIGTVQQGTGGFSGTCTTPCGTVGVSGSYVRTLLVVTATGTITSGCLTGLSFSGNCSFTPTSATPITSYEVNCQFTVGSGEIVLSGTGTISPGLTTGVGSGPTQSFTFSGSGVGAVLGQIGTYSCSVTGNDTIGTIQQGAGGFSGSCNTPCGTVGVNGTYVRTLLVVTATGTITSGCLGGHTFNGNCSFVPTTPTPVTNYAVACQFEVD